MDPRNRKTRHGVTEFPGNRYLSQGNLSYFDRIGRSLQGDESIELAAPSCPGISRLTPAARRRLVEHSQIKEIAQEITVRGFVPELDQQKMQFDLQPPDGRRVPCILPEPHLETTMQAFAEYQSGARVAVHGIGRYGKQGRLLRMEGIEHVSLLEDLDVPARLDELKLLRDGWLDGKGQAPAHEGLEWLTSAFARSYPDELPLPHTYPTPEGGVQFEWTLGGHEASLEVDLSTRCGDWQSVDVASGADEERAIDLKASAGWCEVSEAIRLMQGSSA